MFRDFNLKTILKNSLVIFMIIALTYFNVLIIGTNVYEGLTVHAVDDTNLIEGEVITNSSKEPIFEMNVETSDIHKTKIEDETAFTQVINLKIKDVKDIVLEDVENSFFNKSEAKTESANLKYVKTTLAKDELLKVLGENGTFSILDNEQNIIACISAKDLNTKTTEEDMSEDEKPCVTITKETVEIEYNENISSIRIVIDSDAIQEETDFVIENTKSIYDVSNLDELNYLKQDIKYSYKDINEQEIEEVVENTIKFKDTITRVTMDLDKLTWDLGKTNNVNFKITLDTTSENAELFKDPIFIIKLPECVETVNIENSEFIVENDEGAFTEKNVSIVTLLGNKYILMQFTGEQILSEENTNIILSLDLNLKEEGSESEDLMLFYKNDKETFYEGGNTYGTIINTLNFEAFKKVVPEVVEEVQIEEQDEIEEPEELKVAIKTEKKYFKYGDDLYYLVELDNSNNQPVESLRIEDRLPEGLNYLGVIVYNYNENTKAYTDEIEDEGTVEYDDATKTLTVDFENFEGAKQVSIMVEPQEDAKTIANNIKVKKNNEEIASQDIEVTIVKPTVTLSANNINEKLNLGDEVELEVTINNNSMTSTNETLQINLPNEFEPYFAETDDSSFAVSSKDFIISAFIPEQGSYKVTLFAKYVNNVTQDKNIEIVATLKNDLTATWSTKLLKDENEPVKADKIVEQEVETYEEEEAPKVDNNEEVKTGLVINQYLNKVVVSNMKNTKQIEFDNAESGKIEINPKYINDSTVEMEYKIVVKNEGSTPKLGKQLIDTIPEGLEFDENENENWYRGDDNNIYNDSLVNQLMNPGDEIELAIKLNKKLDSNNNIGTIKNYVKIKDEPYASKIKYTSLSSSGFGQNDSSLVEVTVTKNSNTILYIMLTAVFIIIVVFGIYTIKRTVLKRGGKLNEKI